MGKRGIREDLAGWLSASHSLTPDVDDLYFFYTKYDEIDIGLASWFFSPIVGDNWYVSF